MRGPRRKERFREAPDGARTPHPALRATFSRKGRRGRLPSIGSSGGRRCGSRENRRPDARRRCSSSAQRPLLCRRVRPRAGRPDRFGTANLATALTGLRVATVALPAEVPDLPFLSQTVADTMKVRSPRALSQLKKWRSYVLVVVAAYLSDARARPIVRAVPRQSGQPRLRSVPALEAAALRLRSAGPHRRHRRRVDSPDRPLAMVAPDDGGPGRGARQGERRRDRVRLPVFRDGPGRAAMREVRRERRP